MIYKVNHLKLYKCFQYTKCKKLYNGYTLIYLLNLLTTTIHFRNNTEILEILLCLLSYLNFENKYQTTNHQRRKKACQPQKVSQQHLNLWLQRKSCAVCILSYYISIRLVSKSVLPSPFTLLFYNIESQKKEYCLILPSSIARSS